MPRATADSFFKDAAALIPARQVPAREPLGDFIAGLSQRLLPDISLRLTVDEEREVLSISASMGKWWLARYEQLDMIEKGYDAFDMGVVVGSSMRAELEAK